MLFRSEEVATAVARVGQAEARVALEKETHRRATLLSERGRASVAELDRTTARLLDAEGMLEVRRQELRLLKLGTRKEVITAAKARVADAAAGGAGTASSRLPPPGGRAPGRRSRNGGRAARTAVGRQRLAALRPRRGAWSESPPAMRPGPR